MARVLVIVPTSTYRAPDLLAAASRLGIELTVASDRRQALESETAGTTLTLAFEDSEAAIATVRREHDRVPFAAVLGADDETTLIAAQIAEGLGLAHNPPDAVARCNDKLLFRRALREHDLPHPAFHPIDPADDPAPVLERIGFPCVIKPTFLSASRGVIRADDLPGAKSALARISAMLQRPDVSQRCGARRHRVLVERYLPGAEVSLEGLVRERVVVPLVVFDKPDPLDGPYFEETLFVAPSRLDVELLGAIERAVAAAVDAVGLRDGPIHAEVRITRDGPVVLELAPRAIGGLCPRALRFGTGISLEELLLRHALGEAPSDWRREEAAAGVMMIPVPGRGRLEAIEGVDLARAEPGIVDVSMTVHRGDEIEPLPEGNRYVGFLFARGREPQEVESALRRAHRHLRIRVVNA